MSQKGVLGGLLVEVMQGKLGKKSGSKIHYREVAPYGKYRGGAPQIVFLDEIKDSNILNIKDLKTGRIYTLNEFKQSFPELIESK